MQTKAPEDDVPHADRHQRGASFDDKQKEKIKQRSKDKQKARRAASQQLVARLPVWTPENRFQIVRDWTQTMLKARPSRTVLRGFSALLDNVNNDDGAIFKRRGLIASQWGLSVTSLLACIQELQELRLVTREREKRWNKKARRYEKLMVIRLAFPDKLPNDAKPQPSEPSDHTRTPSDVGTSDYTRTPNLRPYSDPSTYYGTISESESVIPRVANLNDGLAVEEESKRLSDVGNKEEQENKQESPSPSLSPSPFTSCPEQQQAFSRAREPWGDGGDDRPPMDDEASRQRQRQREERMKRLSDEMWGARDPETANRLFAELARLDEEARREHAAKVEYWQRQLQLLGDDDRNGLGM